MTTGGVFLAGALVIFPTLRALDLPLEGGIPAAVLGFVSAAFVFGRPAPKIGTFPNHVLLMASWGVPVLAYYSVLPNAAQATPGFTFTAVLIAFRLTDRSEMVAHLGTVIALLLMPIAFGVASTQTTIAALLTTAGLIALASIVTIVFESAEEQGEDLERLIRRDPLTGVGNRRLLAERLAYELARHERSGQRLTLLALDLNGFKDINDQLGHAAGDELLVAVASTLRANVRGQDTIVRQGGDEFCVMLPETSAQDAARIGASLRDALSQITAGHGPLTTGLGMAEYPRDGTDIDTILRHADAHLRADKASDEGATALPRVVTRRS
ncbi:MAG: GGDEF domain-containing protein [Solirubrobacteraceae bacterium]|nr:GGDEF domain-containing protein [Solirubrobacteraceae bacterium]